MIRRRPRFTYVSFFIMLLALASSATFNPKLVGAIPAPANDDFPGTTVDTLFSDIILPVSLPTGNGCAPSATNADTQPGEPTGPFYTANCPLGSFINSTVWYSTTPQSNGFYVVDTSDSSAGAEIMIRVYTGSAVNNLTPVPAKFICGGPLVGTSCGKTRLIFSVTAGTTYRIQVGAFGNCASPPPQGQIWRINLKFIRCN